LDLTINVLTAICFRVTLNNALGQRCSTRVRQCTRVRPEYVFWGLGLEPPGLGLGLEPQDSVGLGVFRNWTQHCMTWN